MIGERIVFVKINADGEGIYNYLPVANAYFVGGCDVVIDACVGA